jgi:glyoxylase-like metal-dependent hydrolase (beta-lactamase superfamily II)
LVSLFAPAAGVAFEPSGLLEIHYINPTIQARVTLVIGPDGTTVLINAGKAGDIIPDYLASIGLVAGVDDLDYPIAGHLDADHIRGFKDVFPVTGAGYDSSAIAGN